jgi:hypothetical protein
MGDEALKVIYDKYSPTNYNSQVAADVDGMKSMFESLFSIDFGDDLDLSSPEDLPQRADARMHQYRAEWSTKDAERDASRTKRKKWSTQQAAEVRAQAQQARINPSICDGYPQTCQYIAPGS